MTEYVPAPWLRMIAGPHVLYTGCNGSVTAGVTVESLSPPKPGFRHTWDVNTYALLSTDCSELSLTTAEMADVIRKCVELENPGDTTCPTIPAP